MLYLRNAKLPSVPPIHAKYKGHAVGIDTYTVCKPLNKLHFRVKYAGQNIVAEAFFSLITFDMDESGLIYWVFFGSCVEFERQYMTFKLILMLYDWHVTYIVLHKKNNNQNHVFVLR